MTPPNPTTDALTTEIDVNVQLADGSTVACKVRELPVKLFQPAVQAYTNELRFVELCTAMPKGWADNLTPASLTALNDACERVNAGFFAFLERQLRKMQRLGVDLNAAAAKASPGR